MFSKRRWSLYAKSSPSSKTTSRDNDLESGSQAHKSVQQDQDIQIRSMNISPKSFKIRRQGSKLFSRLHRYKTSGNRAVCAVIDSLDFTDDGCLSTHNSFAKDNRAIALALARDAASAGSHESEGARQEIHRGPLSEEVPRPSNGRTMPAPLVCKAIESFELSRKPGLAQQLSRKISSTLGSSTIIRKHKLGHQTQILQFNSGNRWSSLCETDGMTCINSTTPLHQDGSAYVSRLSSSTETSSAMSDSKTSYSEQVSRSESMKIQVQAPICDPNACNQTLPVPPKLETVPTILTVERTANAKIYLETFYDSLLAGATTPRSIRRRDLESRLKYGNVCRIECQHARRDWIEDENAHLRRLRVQKSKVKCNLNKIGVSAAGFEVVRILGKGSFGVVRLVREKDPSSAVGLLVAEASIQIDNRITPASAQLLDPCSQHQVDRQGQVYAMKVIRKSDMLRNCQEGHLRAERDFLVAAEMSRWVVPLVASFQDDANLYLVMEYMAGGDFLGLLFRKNILKEKHARWYIAEMLLCIEETHRRGWIHRDIKPDNFLISASGHLKISDFGLAFDGHWSHDQQFFKEHRKSVMEKLGIVIRGDHQDQEDEAKKASRCRSALSSEPRHKLRESASCAGPRFDEGILQWRNRAGKRKMAASVVGTSQYMAPEVIRSEPYDGRCDWWSLGIILYECLYGFTPFVCENRDDTKRRILDHLTCLGFPNAREFRASSDAVDLIQSLLQEKQHRLCSAKYRLNDVPNHLQDPNKIMSRLKDHRGWMCKGRFVYPNDACDIKAHPFFDRTTWDRHHLTRPPFVPDIEGKGDTKYFDHEDTVNDAYNTTSEVCEDKSGAEITEIDACRSKPLHGPGVDGQVDAVRRDHDMQVHTGLTARLQTRANKRPRDKILRDKQVGRQALEIRKKGVFIGYTYRRPRISLYSL